ILRYTARLSPTVPKQTGDLGNGVVPRAAQGDSARHGDRQAEGPALRLRRCPASRAMGGGQGIVQRSAARLPLMLRLYPDGGCFGRLSPLPDYQTKAAVPVAMNPSLMVSARLAQQCGHRTLMITD